ncbi:MFS transporter [Corticicoccus populi]|uniref:MFS transporter n=1 Tax=Corticicoccus populi TaxID=1812821 RepID=A0ABW5WT48_9STAP
MWTNKNFLYFLSGQIASSIGLALFTTSLPFLVMYLNGNASDISGVQSMFIVPQIFILLIGGVFVDRLPKKTVIILLNILRATALFIISVLIFTGRIELWHIYVLTFLLGLFSTIYQPALRAFLPSVISKEFLIRANSYRSMIRETSEMIGPVFAAFLVTAYGIFLTFGVTAVSFLLAAVSYVFIAVNRPPDPNTRNTIMSDFKSGVKILFEKKWLGSSIFIGSIVNVGIASFDVIILPVYAEYHFDGIQSYGLLLSSMAVGAFLGALVISRQTKIEKRMKKYYSFMLILGLSILLLYFINHFYIVLIIMLLIGFSISSFIILWDSTIQELIEEKFLGRIISLQMFGGLLLLPVGYYFFGVIIDYINFEISIIISALIIILSALTGLLIRKIYGIHI